MATGATSTKTLAKILENMSSTDPKMRRKAVKRLGTSGNPHFALTPVLQAFSDPDLYVRRSAVEAAGRLGDINAVPALCQALSDSSALIRNAAIQALVILNDKRAIPDLKILVNDNMLTVRLNAMKALLLFGCKKDVEVALPAFLSTTQKKQSGQKIVEKAILAYEIYGEACIDTLRPLAANWQPYERLQVVSRLGNQGYLRATELLETDLHSQDQHYRIQSIKVLSRLASYGNQHAFDLLNTFLNDPDEKVQVMAIRYIDWRKSEETWKKIVKILDNASSEIRIAITKRIGELRDRAAIPVLLPLLDDQNPDLQACTVDALATCGYIPILELLTADSSLLQRVISSPYSSIWRLSVEFQDARVIEILKPLLQDPVYYKRQMAIKALLRLKMPETVEPLLTALYDSHKFIRILAIRGLPGLQDARIEPALREMLNDPDPNIQFAVKQELEKLDIRKEENSAKI